MSPRVSVVICFFNGANFLTEAIDSVRAQDLPDWELLLVDDGSRDASPAMARAAADADLRIRCLAHPDGENHGLAASRRLGADAAQGEYLLFLDHDDLLARAALARMAGVLDTAGEGVAAVFACTLFWAWDAALGGADEASSFAPFAPGRTDGRALLRDLIRFDSRHPACCSTLHRRAAFITARDSGPSWDGMYEDTALLMKILARADVWLLEEVLSSYRMHRDSMCNRAEAAGEHRNDGVSRDRLRFLRWALRHLALDPGSRLVLAWTLFKGEARARWVVAGS